jgi:hypothetical protein
MLTDLVQIPRREQPDYRPNVKPDLYLFKNGIERWTGDTALPAASPLDV